MTNNSETLITPSTFHSVETRLPEIDGPDLRHAMIVINRMIRSADKCDKVVHDRLDRAVGVMKATRQTETAFISQRPADVVRRIASRLLRSLGVRT